MRLGSISMLAMAAALATSPAMAAPDASGLLFRASADHDLTADRAEGDPVPNFLSDVTVTPDGAMGGAARWADDGYVAWKAPGNMRAARGTLAFFWRARTPVGEAPFSIFRVGFADQGSTFEFFVSDNGPGIAPEFQDRIWGIFQTLESRDKVEGTGIGLSVVKKIVETRGGRVWIESAPGEGSTFRFTWPKRPVEH